MYEVGMLLQEVDEGGGRSAGAALFSRARLEGRRPAAAAAILEKKKEAPRCICVSYVSFFSRTREKSKREKIDIGVQNTIHTPTLLHSCPPAPALEHAPHHLAPRTPGG